MRSYLKGQRTVRGVTEVVSMPFRDEPGLLEFPQFLPRAA